MSTDQTTARTVTVEVQALYDAVTALTALVDTVRPEEPVTEEPAVGEQVTDRNGDVWERLEGGWSWWMGEDGGWASWLRTWYIGFGPLRATTDDDRRRVGLPVRDEDASPAPVEAPENDAQPEDVSVDPEPENGPENDAQGRIGWLRVRPSDERRYLMREVPGGWADDDPFDDLLWPAKHYPDAEFTPIRTLTDDEVAVKRRDLEFALHAMQVARHETEDQGAESHFRAALEEGR